MLLNRGTAEGGAASMCLTCHDGSLPEAANIATGAVDSLALASGHTLTAGTAGGANVESCATCHDTHGAVDDIGRMIPATSINGVPVNSAGPEMCLACHDAGNSWFGSGYPATSAPIRDAAGYPVSGTWSGPATYASPTNAHRLIPETTVTVGAGAPQPREQGDCRYCHASHRGGNAYDGLVSTFTVPTDATLANDKAEGTYAELCFTCHGGVRPVGFDTTPIDIAQFATSGSGPAGHSIVTSGGLLPVGSPLPCFECHNPHGSSLGNASLISDERGSALNASTGVRAFCFTCHTTADTTAGWNSSSYAAVTAADEVVGIPRDGGVLHLSARDGHAQADSASCYDCHGNSYAVGGNNVHDPAQGGGEALMDAVAATDTVAPITSIDLSGAPTGAASLVATDTGSGVDTTYYTVDGGDLNVGTEVLAASEGTHTVQYWSTDVAQNVETTKTVIFTVDRMAPQTSSDAIASYEGTATITLVAVDEAGGSGVAMTLYRLDGGIEVTGSVVTTTTLGDHTLEYWSVDYAGNVEGSHTTTFTVSEAGGLAALQSFLTVPIVPGAAEGGTHTPLLDLLSTRPPTGFAGEGVPALDLRTG